MGMFLRLSQCELSKFSTVADLRHQALEIFALLDTYADTTRLRLGANRGNLLTNFISLRGVNFVGFRAFSATILK